MFSRIHWKRILVAALSTYFACGFAENHSLADQPVGRWKGEWVSDTTGHRGPMRASIRPNNKGNYSALYMGRFLKVIPFMYRAELVPQDAGHTRFITTKSLGPFLGSYTMQSHFIGPTMQGSFQAGKDQGHVNMIQVSR